MARVAEQRPSWDEPQNKLMQAALSRQIGEAAASSSRIKEAAWQQRIQAEYQGPADLGAGIAQGIRGAAQIKGRKDELQQQREIQDAEIYNRHLDRISAEARTNDIQNAENRRYIAGINARKAEATADRTHAMAMQDEVLVSNATSEYFARMDNGRIALLGFSLTEEAMQNQQKLTERYIDVLERQEKHEQEVVEPVLMKQTQTREELRVDLTSDMFRDIPEGDTSAGTKVVNNELQRILPAGVTPEMLSTTDTAGLIKLVQEKKITSAEVSELRGVLGPYKERLTELLGPVAQKAAEKETKKLVGRRLPFEGPLSDEEIRRRLEAGEEDPWYEKVLAPTSGFFKTYEMEMPSDPGAAKQQALIRTELDKVRNIEEALDWLSSNKAAQTVKMINKEGKETGQSVSDVVNFVDKPLRGLGFGAFMARERAKHGDEPSSLARGIVADMIKAQQSQGMSIGYPKRLQKRIEDSIKNTEGYDINNQILQQMYEKMQSLQGPQGRVDPRAYEAAGGGK